MNQTVAPHGNTKRPRGKLKNGNPAADPAIGLALIAQSPRCTATSKRTGKRCGAPAMANGKCYHHGGASTGATTEAGKKRAAEANLKHGHFTQAAQAERQQARQSLRRSRAVVAIFAGKQPSDLELEA